jgi:HEPN domain-containing protein
MSLPFEDWIKKAESDLSSSKILKDYVLPHLDTSVYHAQQCAEKALKGFLVFKGLAVIKKHDLNFLLTQCENIDSGFWALSMEAASLTPYDTAYRYPGISPDFEPEQAEAENAIKDAEKILNFVKIKMGIY